MPAYSIIHHKRDLTIACYTTSIFCTPNMQQKMRLRTKNMTKYHVGLLTKHPIFNVLSALLNGFQNCSNIDQTNLSTYSDLFLSQLSVHLL